uniref:Methyltransferase type 11 domain-containing protein n=1 Tax=Chaetoceros debilis TaxID=122233 RepID=A0A7S3V7J7_9STRA
MAPRGQFDIVTIMYAFHEIPKIARYRILRESRRLLRPGGILAIVDINPQDYTPSPTMLEGEPYVIEYQNNIEKQMGSIQGFRDMNCIDIIPEHVRMWVLKRCHCNPTGEMMNN